MSVQEVDGLPVYPWSQMQVEMWLMTVHWAFTPQRPVQESWHLLLMQALSEGQSELPTHSGLQLGGEPIMSGMHVHWHLSPISLGGREF